MSFSHLAFDQISRQVALGASVVFAAAFAVYALRQKPTPCDICGGMGSWNCVICDGNGFLRNGRVKKNCKACVGRGKRLCRKCAGSGWNKRSNYIG